MIYFSYTGFANCRRCCRESSVATRHQDPEFFVYQRRQHNAIHSIKLAGGDKNVLGRFPYLEVDFARRDECYARFICIWAIEAMRNNISN